MMGGNSEKHAYLETVTVLEPSSLPCNDTNITISAIGKDDANPLKLHESHRTTAKTSVPSPNFHYLAELYWKYPTVHQEFFVCPLSNKARQHAFLVKARKKSEKLKKDLEKEPEHHRTSVEALPPPKQQKSRSNSTTPGIAVTPLQRRTVNRGMPISQRSIKIDRRPTGSMNRKQIKSFNPSDPSAALAEFRLSKGLIVDDSHTPEILDAIRIRNEDVEQNTCSANCSRCTRKCWTNKCCTTMRAIYKSPRIRYIAIITVVTLALFLCVVAITYPIVKAVLP